jgi:hypothetical protein
MSRMSDEIVGRCQKLGIECEELPTEQITSGLATLACFPMYMVANVHAWTGDTQWKMPVLDLPGAEHIREAFELGKQQSGLGLDKQHRQLLSTLLNNAKPSDLVIYDYASDTIKAALVEVTPDVADTLRAGIAQMIVAVAKASGKGLLGTGKKISDNERACIMHIADELSLNESEAANKALSE